MKRARKVSNVHGELNFKQKQRLTNTFTGNNLQHRKQSRKGAEDFIVDKIYMPLISNFTKTELPYDGPKKS